MSSAYGLAIQLAIQIVAGVIISVITAALTVHLSLRRFYSEKWWERKAEAYSRIVEALQLECMHVEAALTALEFGRDSPDEKRDPLAKQARDARREIAKVTSIGAFIISESVADTLAVLGHALEQADDEPNFYDQLHSELVALKQAMARIRDIVKKELKYR